MPYRTATLLSALLLLGACGGDNQPAPKLFKEQRDVLGKAKAVGPELQKQQEEQQKAADQQTQ